MRDESRTADAGVPHVCPWQRVSRFDNFLRPLLHNSHKLFGPYVRPGMTVLDIGCGAGFTSLALARLVGGSGRVIAADLQPEMLAMVEARAAKAGLSDRIELHRCEATRIGVSEGVDFVLAFWVVHELPDAQGFLKEVSGLLRPGGTLYITEPLVHVSRTRFEQTVDEAQAAGFRLAARPKAGFSRAAALVKPSEV